MNFCIKRYNIQKVENILKRKKILFVSGQFFFIIIPTIIGLSNRAIHLQHKQVKKHSLGLIFLYLKFSVGSPLCRFWPQYTPFLFPSRLFKKVIDVIISNCHVWKFSIKCIFYFSCEYFWLFLPDVMIFFENLWWDINNFRKTHSFSL